MSIGAQSETEGAETAPPENRPELSVCKGCPGRVLFIESKNSDGWIAIDEPTEVTR